MSSNDSDLELNDVDSTQSPHEDNDLRVVESFTLSDRVSGAQSIFSSLPSVLKKDIAAILNCQLPSPAIIVLLLIPSVIFICGLVVLILLARFVYGWGSPEQKYNFSTGFIVFGDYGRNGLYGQDMVGRQMERFCSKERCDFVVTTGDNFYNYGVQSADDILFKTSFEDIYLKGSMKNLKYYHVLGNHDWAGKASAQIEYARRPDTAWELPDFYYEKQFPKANLHFVFLDTTPFTNNVYPFSNKEEMEPRRTEAALTSQLNFLSNSLETSSAKWKFVVGHHPCYSTAQHGDAPEIIRVLDPIFKEHSVDGYIAGHDHNQQHLYRSKVNYFISGAASQMREIVPDHWNLKWSDAKNGFMHFLVADEAVVVRAIEAETLKVIYEYVITKPEEEDKR